MLRSCLTCEFNFGDVCAGHGTRLDNNEDTYGMTIDETFIMFVDGCDDYNISFESFVMYLKEIKRSSRSAQLHKNNEIQKI